MTKNYNRNKKKNSKINHKRNNKINNNRNNVINKNIKNKKRRVNKKRLVLLIFVLFIIILSGYGIFKKITEKLVIKNKVTQSNELTAEEMQKEKEKIINIMIDPAKGGTNTGLSTKKMELMEKDINLDIAKLIASNLIKYKDVNVMLTREYDEDKPIKDRVKLAKENKTDILISIRLNAEANGEDANGIDTYYAELKMSPSIVNNKEDLDSSIEKKEKSNDIKDSDSSIQDISSNNEKSSNKISNSADSTNANSESTQRKELSKKLAIKIQETTISFVKMKDRGVIKNSYDILKYAEMPAVIVHCGFITNKSDASILEDKEKLKELANGISSGILDFIDKNRDDIILDRINYR